MSLSVDNLQVINEEKKKYLIELFSGSGTVSTIAKATGYKTTSIDIEEKYKPDIVKDIMKLSIHNLPDSSKTFIIWASLPCTYYSILNAKDHWTNLRYAHRQYYYLPKTKEAIQSILLLEKVLWLIKKINPVYYFIENPRGVLRHVPQMKAIPFRSTVSYADYEANVYKPTDIFHNCPFLSLTKLSNSVGKSFSGSVAKMNNAFSRSIVPPCLVQSILSQIEEKHF